MLKIIFFIPIDNYIHDIMCAVKIREKKVLIC